MSEAEEYLEKKKFYYKSEILDNGITYNYNYIKKGVLLNDALEAVSLARKEEHNKVDLEWVKQITKELEEKEKEIRLETAKEIFGEIEKKSNIPHIYFEREPKYCGIKKRFLDVQKQK